MSDETKKIIKQIKKEIKECIEEENRREDVFYNCGVLDALKVVEQIEKSVLLP